MAIDTASPRSRRALLAGAIGAAAATAAAALRPLSAHAADGQAVFVGGEYTASSATSFNTLATGAIALIGGSTTATGVWGTSGSGVGVLGSGSTGVWGDSQSGKGILGTSGSSTGVTGQSFGSGSGVFGATGTQSGYGVWGQNSAAGGTAVYGNVVGSTMFNSVAVAGRTAGHYSQIGVRGIADPEGIGVHGLTANGVGVRGEAPGGWGVHGVSDNRGVFGETTSGRGVHGQATIGRGVNGVATSGHGVHGEASSGIGVRGLVSGTGTAGSFGTADPRKGYALQTSGRLRFDKSVGIATINAGNTSITVTPGIDLTTTSAVVATLQGNAGSATTTVSRCFVNASTNQFTIYLTSAATVTVKVAWHVFG